MKGDVNINGRIFNIGPGTPCETLAGNFDFSNDLKERIRYNQTQIDLINKTTELKIELVKSVYDAHISCLKNIVKIFDTKR